MAREDEGGRLRWWWWDLPLRWKGRIVVLLPTVMLVIAAVVALVYDAQRVDLRAHLRADRAQQGRSAAAQQQLAALESSVIRFGVTGDPDELARWEERVASLTEVTAELVGEADEAARAEVQDAAAAAEARVARLSEAHQSLLGGGAASNVNDLIVAVTSARRPSDAAFTTLDTHLAAEVAELSDAIDARGRAVVVVLVGGVVLAVGAAFCMVTLFTKGIARRIADLGATTARVIDGGAIGDLDEAAKDEIGTLASQLVAAGELLLSQTADLTESRDAERRRLRWERIVREVAHRVHESLGQQGVLEAAVRELGQALDADRALMLGVHADGRAGAIVAEWAADGREPLGVGNTLPTDDQRDENIARVVRSGDPLVVDDVAETAEMLPQTRRLLTELGIGSMLLAPVSADGEPLALLVLLTVGRARPWMPGAARLARVVAADVATSLRHARLYEREKEMVARLQELDQAKTDFVASVSHELRTPLTSIRGYVEMLQDGDAGELDSEQRQMLAVVERNTERLLMLIEDLLTLSKIESGSFRVAMAPVALGDVVATAVEELRLQADARGVALISDVAADLPEVSGDAGQLERVLFNLLSNAIKFSPEGGTVTVRVGHDDTQVTLEVADEGIGIPDAEQQRLFTRFFRSSTSQAEAIPGTGLGLVIAKSIVDNHGGEVDVHSRPGEGTTFIVRLPAVAPASAGAVR